MHYYQFNIGDYRKDTSFLSLLEHGIYRALLDTYYLNEGPLCDDLADLMRTHCVRTAEEQEAFNYVIEKFFEKTKKGYVHKKCEEIISQYAEKSEKARASAKARWNAKAMRTHSEGNANHKPITNNHKPLTSKDNSASTASTDFSVFTMMTSEQISEMRRIRRKNKGGAITDRVAKALVTEFNLAIQSGLTVDQCLTEWETRAWKSFKAEWMKPRVNGYAQAKAQRQKEADDWANSSGTGMFDYGNTIDGEVTGRE